MRRLGLGDAYDARYRIYDAQLRLFWSKDPLGWVDGYDRWAYVGGDPVNTLNPGPLPRAVANTFRGGSYTAITVPEATTLYRVYGGKAGQIRGYWTRTKPAGPVQSSIDSALNPQWGNTATNVATVRVPAGTTIYEGAAAAQGGLVGGGSRVFIPNVNPASLVP